MKVYIIFITRRVHCPWKGQSYFDKPRLAPQIDGLFLGQRDLLDKGYITECFNSALRNYMVDTGILPSNIKFPSHEFWVTFCTLTIYIDNPPPIRLCTRLRPYYHLDFYRIMRGIKRAFATCLACRQGTLTPLDTWSSPVWDLHTLCMFNLLRPIIFPTFSIFNRTMHFEHPLVRFQFCIIHNYFGLVRQTIGYNVIQTMAFLWYLIKFRKIKPWSKSIYNMRWYRFPVKLITFKYTNNPILLFGIRAFTSGIANIILEKL